MIAGAGQDHLRILSRPDWVEPVVMFIKHRAAAAGITDPDRLNRLVVAMTEAVTNAIVHGNFGLPSELKDMPGEFGKALKEKSADPACISRVVDIRLERTGDACVWTVTDQGPGFDVESLLAKLDAEDDDNADEALSAGRGLAIMRAFVDEVTWADGGRQVRLTIRTGGGTIENRRAKRHRYTAAVAVCMDGWKMPVEGVARDLSQNGIGLVLPAAVNIGTAATVTLNLRHASQRAVRGTIVRCHRLAGDYHDVAIEFTGAMLPTNN